MEELLILFFIFVTVFHGVLLAAIVFAAMAYFGEDKNKQDYRYAMSAKLILVLGLITIVGVGSCFAIAAVY